MLLLVRLLLIAIVSPGWALADANQNHNFGYNQLMQELQHYVALEDKPWPTLHQVKPNSKMFSPFITELTNRLQLLGDLPPNTQNNAISLNTALKRFQWRHSLNPNGLIDAQTLQALNITPWKRAAEIKLNLEAWSMLPQNMGSKFILINIPAYNLSVIDHGKTVFTSQVIVGRTNRQTPELVSAINNIAINPYWNVPESLFAKDILPKLISDPEYLQQAHLELVELTQTGVVVRDPQNINWDDFNQYNSKYMLRQQPGPHNSLGLIKFDFPNTYNVLLHDTPNKKLFARQERLFSSGCIRIKNPFGLLAYLLDDQPKFDWHTIADILAANKTKFLAISSMPIYVIYSTTWIDHFGMLHFGRDPYNYYDDYYFGHSEASVKDLEGMLPGDFYL